MDNFLLEQNTISQALNFVCVCVFVGEGGEGWHLIHLF